LQCAPVSHAVRAARLMHVPPWHAWLGPGLGGSTLRQGLRPARGQSCTHRKCPCQPPPRAQPHATRSHGFVRHATDGGPAADADGWLAARDVEQEALQSGRKLSRRTPAQPRALGHLWQCRLPVGMSAYLGTALMLAITGRFDVSLLLNRSCSRRWRAALWPHCTCSRLAHCSGILSCPWLHAPCAHAGQRRWATSWAACPAFGTPK